MIQNSFIILLAAGLLLQGCSAAKPANSASIPNNSSQADARIIDVRTAGEYRAAHLDRAINIPYDQIGQKISEVTTNKSDLLLVHCQSGHRSAIAKTTLESMGYTNVSDLGSLENARQVTGK